MPQDSSSQVLVEFDSLVAAPDGGYYAARACGRPMSDGLWEGWVEFIPVAAGTVLSTSRETVQPNQTDLAYWAAGLSMVYLEGALQRARDAAVGTPRVVGAALSPIGPVPSIPPTDVSEMAPALRAVLDPFEVYNQGENVLRQQLHALDVAHLEQIVKAYHFAPLHATSGGTVRAALEAAILDGVRDASL